MDAWKLSRYHMRRSSAGGAESVLGSSGLAQERCSFGILTQNTKCSVETCLDEGEKVVCDVT